MELRCSDRRDGLTNIFQQHLRVLPLNIDTFSSLECLACELTDTIIATVTPPQLNSVFFRDFANLLTHLSSLSPNVERFQHSYSNLSVAEIPITDHFLLSFNLTLSCSSTKPTHLILFRNIKNIDMGILTIRLDNSQIPDFYSPPDDLVLYYNNCLLYFLDSLAPV